MPLSILLNDGAHKGFRSYKFNSILFAIKEVYDFKNDSIFEAISTRYGFVHFKRDEQQVFPVPFAQVERGKWVFKKALPIIDKDDPWTIVESDVQKERLLDLRKIAIPENSKPRQGVNTCGANDVFIFDRVEAYRDDLCLAINSKREKVIIPKQFLHPLVTKENFAQKLPTPRRFILLPYHKENGKPLSARELQSHPELWEYLTNKKHILQKRKGVLINAWIRKGFWWALLGVGPYSFAPFKIIWEAYGKVRFNPKLFEERNFGIWQGNQAMHAYIPVASRVGAERILSALPIEEIQTYLMAFQMEGTCNWAQPGKMKKLFNFTPKEKARQLNLRV